MSAVTFNQHSPLLAHYDAGLAYDELLDRQRRPRPHYQALYDRLLSLPADELNRRKSAAEFLLLNDTFPFSVNYAATRMSEALNAIAEFTDTRKHNPIVRRVGRLKATLDYGQIDEVTADELSSLLESIRAQCAQIHADVHQTYIAYPVDEKLAVLP